MFQALVLFATTCLPAQGIELQSVLQKIEETRSQPYAQRYRWVKKLQALKSDAARRAALDLYRKEDQPGLKALLLEHAAGLPGLRDTMVTEITASNNQRVSTVAAAYVLGDGDSGLATCLRILDRTNAPVAQQGILVALGEARSKRARAAFQERFAKLPPNSGYMVLLRFRNKRGAHLDAVRRASLGATYTGLRGEAIRQMALLGDKDALRMARDLADDPKTATSMAYVLFDVLVKSPAPEDLPRLARLVSSSRSSLHRQLTTTLPKLAADDRVLQWARADGAKSKEPAVRGFAVRILEHSNSTETTDALLDLTQDRDAVIRRRALMALAKRGDRRVVPVLEKAFKDGSTAGKLDALEALDLVLGEDAKFWQRLLAQGQRGPVSLRLIALDLATAHRMPELLKQVPALLKHKDWRMRAAGIRIAETVRDKSSIPLLINAMMTQRGRLAEDLRRALASLTRLFFNEAKDWQRWWKREGKSFVLPPPEIKDQKPKHRPSGGQVTSRTSATFYGIPVISDRVVYCLDVSGSMSARIGTGTTRLEVAQEALIQALKTSPSRSLVNVIFFETGLDEYEDKLVPLRKRTVLPKLTAFIRKQKPRGGTNIHGALVAALEDEKVDTVFLLSDGAPSAGEITDINALAEDILRRNRTRRVVIHGISIGTDSPLLKRLAEATGGRYTRQ